MRHQLVMLTLAAAMAAGMLLSPKLWLTERHYPHVPVWDGMPTMPPPGDKIVFGAMLLLLGLTMGIRRQRWPILAFVALAGAWSLWDQSRWQPWFYQYLFMLAALGFAGADTRGRREAGMHACRLILAATYFWSGLQKINVGFATNIYPWIMAPIMALLPEDARGWIAAQGWHAAILECGLGLCLLAWPTRLVAVPLLVVMHAVILLSLSPLGHNWNSVVWPWNLAMIALTILLFVNARSVTPRRILWPRRCWFARVSLILFGVMPLFNFVGWWDGYLSAALYSDNTLEAKIRVSDEIAAKLPPEVRARYLDGKNQLDLSRWSMGEMNVPDYPARRVYRGIARRLGPAPHVTLDIEERPHWRTGVRKTVRETLDDR